MYDVHSECDSKCKIRCRAYRFPQTPPRLRPWTLLWDFHPLDPLNFDPSQPLPAGDATDMTMINEDNT